MNYAVIHEYAHAHKLDYNALCSVFRAALILIPAPSAEVETVEVVGYRYTSGHRLGGKWHYQATFPKWDDRKVRDIGQMDELMTIAQHQRIVAAKDAELGRANFQSHCHLERAKLVEAKVAEKDAEIARLNEGFFRANKDALGVALERDELRAQLAAQPAAVPVGWRDLAKQAAEALQVFTGHDSGANLRHRYGENWWEPLDELRDKLRAALKAAPAAPQQGVSVPEALLRRLVQGKPQDHESRAEGAALLREFARLNADRSAQGGE